MSDDRTDGGPARDERPRGRRAAGARAERMQTGTESIREQKRLLRREMNRLLRRLAEADARRAGARLLERVKAWMNADGLTGEAAGAQPRIFAFASFGREPDTWQLLRWLWSRNRSVCLPRVEGRRMHFYPVPGEDDLAPTGYRGVAEPVGTGDPVLPASGDLIIVPGLAFTSDGARLGRGGGYYDRFLVRRASDSVAAGIGYRFQLLDSLPVGEHDAYIDDFWPLDSAGPPSHS